MQIGNCNIENINERDAIGSFGIDSVRVFARVLLSYRHCTSEDREHRNEYYYITWYWIANINS